MLYDCLLGSVISLSWSIKTKIMFFYELILRIGVYLWLFIVAILSVVVVVVAVAILNYCIHIHMDRNVF